MKDFLKKIIDAKQTRAQELRELIKKSTSADEVRSLGTELDTVLEEQRSAQTQLDALNKTPESRGFNPLGTYGAGSAGAPTPATIDRHDSPEYRTAFMNYVCRNTPFPEELREDAFTTTTDASAVIPTTILNEIIRKMDTYGEIYARVRKLNVQGGVDIPVLSLKPTATWITANTGTSESDLQKIQANTHISFSYYGLECKVAQTLLTNVTTLEMFQSLFTELATEAIIKALESAIISGDGSGKMTGITADTRVPAGNKITISSTDFTSWEGWKKKVFAKMAKAYRNGVFLMAQATFDGYIDGMVDSVGQPIGRVNYGIDGGETYRFGGKEVLTVEDNLIAAYEDASTNDVVAIFVNLNDYAINSNLSLQIVKWTDPDTNTIKNKAILICDGKLVDPNGVLIIKKGA